MLIEIKAKDFMKTLQLLHAINKQATGRLIFTFNKKDKTLLLTAENNELQFVAILPYTGLNEVDFVSPVQELFNFYTLNNNNPEGMVAISGKEGDYNFVSRNGSFSGESAPLIIDGQLVATSSFINRSDQAEPLLPVSVLANSIADLKHCIPNDMSRARLNAFHFFSTGKRKAYAEASNGHILGRVNIATTDHPFDICVPSGLSHFITTLSRLDTSSEALIGTFQNGDDQHTMLIFKSKFILFQTEVYTTFPDCDKIIPKVTPLRMRVAKKEFIEIVKIAQKAQKTSETGRLVPIYMTMTGQEQLDSIEFE